MKNQQISAKVIADSTNAHENRITTMVVTFPRIILAEFNTHRMFSRNSASSRAIPFEKMVKSVKENPFVPIAWQADHKGMQGTEYLNERDSEVCDSAWLVARNKAVEQAEYLATRNSTKQLCNRLLEPFMYHTVIVTATEWENFFALRCPNYRLQCAGGEVRNFRSKKEAIERDDTDSIDFRTATDKDWREFNTGQAEIHMMALAEAMWDAYNESIPILLPTGQWHIPFANDLKGLMEYINPQVSNPNVRQMSKFVDQSYYQEQRIKVSTARCARVSYTVVGEEHKEPNYDADIKLHDILIKNGHASPTEHIAQAMDNRERSRNFTGGWKQYREILGI